MIKITFQQLIVGRGSDSRGSTFQEKFMNGGERVEEKRRYAYIKIKGRR